MEFTWKVFKVFAEGEKIIAVHYGLSISDNEHSVEAEGNHTFKEGTVNMPYEDIKEYNLFDWLNKEITEDNPIKLNLVNQLNMLKKPQNNKLPWLANTFTPGV